MKFLVVLLYAMALTAGAVEQGDLIINEVRYNSKKSEGTDVADPEAVELLIVKTNTDLNGLMITDRNVHTRADEEQCVLNDLGKGFLKNIHPGTLLVIYDGKGEDDIDPSDFVLSLYTQSSLFINASPTGHGFRLANNGDNIHLLYEGQQIDFVKYSLPDRMPYSGRPGSLNWEKGMEGFVDISEFSPGCGIQFMGDSVEMNDYLATWRVYGRLDSDNIGQPNGSRNTKWIEKLRAAN